MTLREALGGIGGKIKRGFRAIMGWDLDPYGYDQSKAAPNPAEPTAQSRERQLTDVVEAAESRDNLRTLLQLQIEADKKIDELRLQLQSITEQRDEARHEVEELRGQVRGLTAENARLTEQIHEAENYLDQSLDDFVEEQLMDDEEYYKKKKQEWDAQGLDGMKKNEKMKAHAKIRDSIIEGREGSRTKGQYKGLDFTDEARTDVHNTDEKIDSAMKEAKLGNMPGVSREMKSGPLDIPNGNDENNVF